jgi:hypothetical protein
MSIFHPENTLVFLLPPDISLIITISSGFSLSFFDVSMDWIIQSFLPSYFSFSVWISRISTRNLDDDAARIDSEERYQGYEYSRFAVAELLGKVEVEARTWVPPKIMTTPHSSDFSSPSTHESFDANTLGSISKEIQDIKGQLGALIERSQSMISSAKTENAERKDAKMFEKVKENMLEELTDLTMETRKLSTSYVRLERAGDRLEEWMEKEEADVLLLANFRKDKKLGGGAFMIYTMLLVGMFLILFFKYYVYPVVNKRAPSRYPV